MTEQLAESVSAATPPPKDCIRDALMESRQRWRNLLTLAADLAFETDVDGRFVLIAPDTTLGWPAETLIGQPCETLFGDDATGAMFNPFRPSVPVRRYRTWLRRADGKLTMMAISAAPLLDGEGRVVGARGIGVDITDCDSRSSYVAGRLRREEVLHYILSRVKRETSVDSMMDTALWAMIHATGAEGAAVIGTLRPELPLQVLHECGPGASEVLDAATPLVAALTPEAGQAVSPGGRLVLAAGCETRSGEPSGLAIWRSPGSPPWDEEDRALAGSAVCIVRMVMDYEAMQREMARQARTDPLTGLLNTRAFIEEMRRQIARLERDSEGGTLLFVDLDAFKSVNDRLGHAMGDQVLLKFADILRRMVRPFDLIARLGGDEFAVWLTGADHLTAAERADYLCRTAPAELQAVLPEEFPKLGVSVGIATRRVGSQEPIEEMTRRADMAMYEVKRSGRRHWRVSLLEGD